MGERTHVEEDGSDPLEMVAEGKRFTTGVLLPNSG